jgi:ubiquinol-cytochrome c reductase cytochrome c subunit
VTPGALAAVVLAILGTVAGGATLAGTVAGGATLAGTVAAQVPTPPGGVSAQVPTPPGGVSAQAPTPPSPQGQGGELYLRDCAWCHGANLEGTSRGPTLVGTGEASNRFYLTTGRMPIADPNELIRRRPSVYSAALGGGPASPAVDPAAGDLGPGGELYRLHCGQCHGATGAGFPLLSGRSSPAVWNSTAVEVAQAIRVGPGGMPVFSPETLTDQEVNAIVRYVLYLQDPDDRGGFHLFRVGPLTEGIVAWLVGIVLLLFAARLLGEDE